MQVKETMTHNVEYMPCDTNVIEAAKRMQELECGFLPVGDPREQKLKGVITDRDITLRAVARGLDLEQTRVDQLMTDQVLYCYENDDIERIADNMRTNGIYRLVVLDNDKDKQLKGVISLGDIARWHDEQITGHIVKGIAA
ncbi:MAG: CBS domain-containing protein [Gammaproteobacteria bacterium]